MYSAPGIESEFGWWAATELVPGAAIRNFGNKNPNMIFLFPAYDDFQIQISSTNFVESDPVPKDAQVIGQTWQ